MTKRRSLGRLEESSDCYLHILRIMRQYAVYDHARIALNYIIDPWDFNEFAVNDCLYGRETDVTFIVAGQINRPVREYHVS